jgi:hypothetical protein
MSTWSAKGCCRVRWLDQLTIANIESFSMISHLFDGSNDHDITQLSVVPVYPVHPEHLIIAPYLFRVSFSQHYIRRLHLEHI